MRQVRLEMADFIIISHTQHHSFILADIKFPKSLLRSLALTLGASQSKLRWTGRCLDVGTCSLSEPPSRSPSQLHGFLLFFILTVLINILIWLKIKTMRRALDDIGNCKKRLNTLVGRQLWQCFDGNRGLGNLRRRNVRKMFGKSLPQNIIFFTLIKLNMMIFQPMYSSFPISFMECELKSKTEGKKISYRKLVIDWTMISQNKKMYQKDRLFPLFWKTTSQNKK